MKIKTRASFLESIQYRFTLYNVCAILGPRQCGKTTLAHMFMEKEGAAFPAIHFFDLENQEDWTLLDNAMFALKDLKGLVVIDEIQRKPELFLTIRVLADTTSLKFLLLGSASPQLVQHTSESLAGRISYIELTPFTFMEVREWQSLWVRGGFPRAYLAVDDKASFLWREDYIQTFLERDIPSLGIKIPPRNLGRFWMMISHYHGQILNMTEIGRAFGISTHTVRKYLEILEATFMVRLLQPWFANIGKRQIKAPKLYIRDSGILHTLLAIQDYPTLHRHPKLGASWEGFALEECLKGLPLRANQVFFWRTQAGAELDLFFSHNGQNIGVEFKFSERIKITPSMKHALHDLKLDKLFVVYPGEKTFAISEAVSVVPLPIFLGDTLPGLALNS